MLPGHGVGRATWTGCLTVWQSRGTAMGSKYAMAPAIGDIGMSTPSTLILTSRTWFIFDSLYVYPLLQYPWRILAEALVIIRNLISNSPTGCWLHATANSDACSTSAFYHDFVFRYVQHHQFSLNCCIKFHISLINRHEGVKWLVVEFLRDA